MPKPSPLQKALETSERRPDPIESRPRKLAASRAGKVLIGGFFAPEAHVELKIIAAREGITLQELLTRALDDLLAKHGRPQIAGLSAARDGD